MKKISDKMPIHTSKRITIPRTFSLGLPKNAIDYSDKVYNKFLNSNLHEIEEAEHNKLLSTNWKNWFYQQSIIHKKAEATNHDGFFNVLKNNLLYGHKSTILGCGFLINPYTFPTVVTGATIETNDGSGGSGASRGINQIELAKFPNTGVVATTYNQLSYNGNNTLGNIEMGVYAEDTPNALLVNSGSMSAFTTYALKSVTEFTLTHTQNWFAWNNSAGAEWYYKTVTNGTKTKAVTFGSMPNPAGSGYSTTTTTIQGKMAHS